MSGTTAAPYDAASLARRDFAAADHSHGRARFWELSVRVLDIPPWLPPAPNDVVDRFFKTTTLWYHTGLTCSRHSPGL